MRSKFGNIVLQWSEVERGRFGDGISRPRPGQKTRPYRIEVLLPQSRPMVVTLPAPNRRSAARYARNRWPGAAVTVL